MKELLPGDKLLHRATHESLTFVQHYDDERLLVSDNKKEFRVVYIQSLCIDHDRQFMKAFTNFISKLWSKLSLTA